PFTRHAIAGVGHFLLSMGGYGTSSTQLLNADGSCLQQWQSNGAYCVAPTGEVLVVEEFQRRQHMVILRADGSHQQGPALRGPDTTYPALSQNQDLIFWRHGQLIAIDRELKAHVLHSDDSLKERLILSRMLLSP